MSEIMQVDDLALYHIGGKVKCGEFEGILEDIYPDPIWAKYTGQYEPVERHIIVLRGGTKIAVYSEHLIEWSAE